MIFWERQEPGWYTSDVGAIVKEHDGKWYVYTANKDDGPFQTLLEAKDNAEKFAPR